MNSLLIKVGVNMSVGEVKNLEGLVEAFRREGVEEALLRECLEQLQEQLVSELCGSRYRPLKQGYRRAGTRKRTIKTRRGPVSFRLAIVQADDQGKLAYPLLECLNVRPYQRMSRDLIQAAVGLSLRSTYGDASLGLWEATGIRLGKSTLHRQVQETAPALEAHYRDSLPGCACPLVFADGTQTHGIRGKNEVNVAVGVDADSGEKVLLGLGVNRCWGRIREQATPFVCEDAVVIADAEPAIRQNMLEQNQSFQCCILHAVKTVNYYLWSQGVSAEERKTLRRELEQLLYTLKNSVLKHLKDHNLEALEQRIDATKRGLRQLATNLKEKGYCKAYRFIQNSGNHLLTFAYLALKGLHVPWTSNLIERVMGEVAKRCKNRWMHWSTQGLQNILTFVLIQFTQPQRLQKFWKDFLGPIPLFKFTLTNIKEAPRF